MVHQDNCVGVEVNLNSIVKLTKSLPNNASGRTQHLVIKFVHVHVVFHSRSTSMYGRCHFAPVVFPVIEV